MNFKSTSKIILAFLALLFTTNLSAQITIGSTEPPIKGSILQLKNIDGSGSITSTKGLLLPRVTLTDLSTLYPMLEKDDEYVNGTTANDENLKHIGLVVYNVGCHMTGEGFYVWTGKKWEAISPRKIESTDAFKGANSYILKPNSSFNIPVERAFAIWRAYKKAGSIVTTDEIESGKVLDLAAVNNLSGNLTVEVLWEQTNNMGTSGVLAATPTIVGSDETAEINVQTGTEYGNALIALKIDGNILWTWHIWLPDGDPTDLDAQIYCYGGLVWMDRNIGATDTITSSRSAYGLYYQFGRMLPFKMANNNQIAINQNKTGDETNMLTFAIQNTEFILRPFSTNVPHDWYSNTTGKWANRWGGSGGAKSPFDPCPEGWRVPYTIKHTSPWPEYGSEVISPPGTWTNGFSYKDTDLDVNLGYWPAGGHIHCSSGEYIEQAQTGNNWGATSDFNLTYPGRYYRLIFASNYIQSTASGLLSHGLAVRCVAEYE